MIEMISVARDVDVDESMAEVIETIDGVIEVDKPVRDPRLEAARDWRGAMIEMIGAIRGARGIAVACLVALSLTGCSSLVDDPCAPGYLLRGETCVERIGPDAGIDGPVVTGDGGTPDGGTPDGSMLDGRTPDGRTPDGGVPDGRTPDGGVPDGSTPDGGVPDGSTPDGGVPDGRTPDGGVPDGRTPDGRTPDGRTPDAPIADAGVDSPPPPDAPVCAAPSKVCDGTCTDVTTAADDCGSCGHVCASGICVAGQCAGELAGHIVAIGHDYQQRNAAMSRVIGNSAALASSSDLGIAHIVGTATVASRTGTVAAVAGSLASMGRAAHQVVLPAVGSPLTGIDVLIVDAQTGDGPAAEALGAAWKTAIDELLARHGVVIVVEGAGGVSHRFAASAGLFTVATPIETTGAPAFVANASDAIVQQVVSPYLADTTSVDFPAVVGVIATPAGTVVMHLTR